jgi:hypothetical protein
MDGACGLRQFGFMPDDVLIETRPGIDFGCQRLLDGVSSCANERVIVVCVVTSCTRLFEPPDAGTRTQQTNSALPMSKAATRSMICSSSVDSANIDAHLPPPRDMELDGVAVRGDHQAGNRI